MLLKRGKENYTEKETYSSAPSNHYVNLDKPLESQKLNYSEA